MTEIAYPEIVQRELTIEASLSPTESQNTSEEVLNTFSEFQRMVYEEDVFDAEALDISYEKQEKPPFAFDLTRERELIQSYGDEYKEFFKAQAHYYAKETYGKVPIIQFQHEIKRDEEGNVTIMYGGDRQTIARESYLQPALDESLPLWLRERALKDYEGVVALEAGLEEAELGDTFVDISPTAFEISFEERVKWNFGHHSFLRLHQLMEIDGKEQLVSFNMRNLLDEPEQYELFTRLTGADISQEETLLGLVGKLKPELQLGHVEKIAQTLYDQTPEDRKIVDESDQVVLSDQLMEKGLQELDPWVDIVYEMMKQRMSKKAITTMFQGWEKAVKAMVDGEEIDTKFLKFLHEFNIENFVQSIDDDEFYSGTPFDDYISRDYSAGASSCGDGSGFSDMGEEYMFGGNSNSSYLVSAENNYQMATKLQKIWNYDKKGECKSKKSRRCKKQYPYGGLGPCFICLECEKMY